MLQFQLMEDGLTGASGVHAPFPVPWELVKETERVTTHSRKMAGRTAWGAALNLRAAMNSSVLVSPFSN